MSSLYLSVGYKTLATPSTNCATIFSDLNPASATVLSSNILQFLIGSAKMWLECIPSVVSCIFLIPFPKACPVLSSFIDNVISQVDILLSSVGIKICDINIPQLLNFFENSIDRCVHIKNHLLDHIFTLVNHLRCGFYISGK